MLALSVVVQVLIDEPESLDEAIKTLAAQADLDSTALLRMTRRLQEQFAFSLARA